MRAERYYCTLNGRLFVPVIVFVPCNNTTWQLLAEDDDRLGWMRAVAAGADAAAPVSVGEMLTCRLRFIGWRAPCCVRRFAP